ncbi:MAG: hypothetical protein CMK09_01385 [Ponticaulis sp.]|nr:hypothetical protein [Ponticaulis sp.]|tara:strand:+ start:14458 stop:14769 length:312 start_codon:yes stop_codon:yes gene_type:complete
MTEFADVLNIENTANTPKLVFIEPWIEELTVPAGSILKIIGESSIAGTFEYDRDTGTVWGWPGSNVTAFIGDRAIWASEMECPGLPNGVTLRSFTGTMGWQDT